MNSTTNLIGISLCLVIGVVTAPTSGQTLIWNNEFGRVGTAASHLTDPYRSLLDDFNFDQPVIMTDFSMLFIWTTGGVDKGERVELTLWSDSRGEPDEPFFIATLMAYEEVCTGEVIFGRELLDIHQQVKPFLIAPGPTWLEMHEVGSENGFQLMTFVNDEPGWVCWEDFPPCPQSSDGELFSFPVDFSHLLFGFIPGEAAEGFIRIIDPVLFSGEPQGGVDDIREDDESYYVLHAGPGIQVSRAHSARVIFETTLPDLPLDRMDLRVQSIGTRPNVRQEILLFDFDANHWVILDNQPLPNTGPDLVVTIENLPEPERFINDSDGQTRLHVEAYSGPSLSVIPHQLKVNKVNFVLTYTP